MKKLNILLIALFAFSNAMTQGCLPDGILFTTQEQIDNFQTDYPGCTEIEGDVSILGDDIENLNGLSVVTSIGGNLTIGKYWSANPLLQNLNGLNGLTDIAGNFKIAGNLAMNSLSGLENLKTIGEDFTIAFNALIDFTGLDTLATVGGNLTIQQNSSLTSLAGLEQLETIGGNLIINFNNNLISLSGIDNIDPNSISGIGISQNNSLSTCEVESICEYLAIPEAIVDIHDNANGCNSRIEVVVACEIAVPCITWYKTFTRQGQIDSFPINYPGCNYVEGDIYIRSYNGDMSIKNFNGLNFLDSINGSLVIESNQGIESLIGFENLVKVGYLYIGSNYHLADIQGMSNLTTVDGTFTINTNYRLTDISGLNNLENIGEKLEITNNTSLAVCNALWVCRFMGEHGNLIIYTNAPGCNDWEEVKAACLVDVKNIFQTNAFSIFPNPSSSRFTIQFNLENKEQVKLLVLNNLGQVVATLANETLSEGEHEINWNAEGMPAGVYFYNIQIGNQAGTGKMVLMK